jgi:hypothetical protein
LAIFRFPGVFAQKRAAFTPALEQKVIAASFGEHP